MYFLNTQEGNLMAKWRDFKRLNRAARISDFKIIKPEERLVDIICYCLNENHYHKILKQLKDKGIETFMQKLGTSYAMYFNKKYNRVGALFQGPFKSVFIDSNEYFLYLSVYVNANNFIHDYKRFQGEALGISQGLALESWQYCSLPNYFGQRDGVLCNMKPILDQFKNIEEYKEFVQNNALYLKDKKELEKLILE